MVRGDIASHLPVSSDVHSVIKFAKRTGDYAVLSHVDLSLVALTHALHKQAETEDRAASEEASCSPISIHRIDAE